MPTHPVDWSGSRCPGRRWGHVVGCAPCDGGPLDGLRVEYDELGLIACVVVNEPDEPAAVLGAAAVRISDEDELAGVRPSPKSCQRCPPVNRSCLCAVPAPTVQRKRCGVPGCRRLLVANVWSVASSTSQWAVAARRSNVHRTRDGPVAYTTTVSPCAYAPAMWRASVSISNQIGLVSTPARAVTPTKPSATSTTSSRVSSSCRILLGASSIDRIVRVRAPRDTATCSWDGREAKVRRWSSPV